MRWLIHGSVTPAAVAALHRHEQQTRTPAEIELPTDATPAELLRAAHKAQLELITTDSNLASTLYEERLPFGHCIVLLNVEAAEVEQDDAIDRLFERYKRLTGGRLYTVTGSRVKIRQLPGGHIY
jgi:hypothetical protein